MVRMVSISDVAEPGERTAHLGKYHVVLECDGVSHDFSYRVELPPSGGHSVSWEPAKSFLSDVERVPVTLVAAVTELVLRFHRGESIALPMLVEPIRLGRDSALLRL